MQLLCGQCGQVQTVDDESAEAIECSHCGHEIVMPGAFDPAATVTNAEPPAVEEGFAEIAQRSVPRKVRLTCPECDKRFAVSARRAGRQGRCPACGSKVNVPYPDDEMEFDLPHVEHADLAEQDEVAVELVAIEDAGAELGRRADETLVLPRDPVQRRKESLDQQAAALAEAAAEAAAPAPPPAAAPARPLKAAKPAKPAPAPTTAPATGKAAPVPAAVVELDRPRRKPQRSKGIYALIAAGVVLAIGGGLAMHFLGGKVDTPPEDPTPNGGVTPPPTCRVISARFGIQGADPPPGKKYLLVVTRLGLPDETPAREFRAEGKDVMLSDGRYRLASLGLATAGVPPTVRIEPGQSRDLTFLFLVPADISVAKLRVRGIGTASVHPPALPAQATCEVLSANFDKYDGAEAPEGKKYLMVRTDIELAAGASARDFRVDGESVTLSFGHGKTASLGLAGPPKRGRVRLEPGASRQLTFVFLVPDNLSRSKLTIHGIGSNDVPRPPREDSVAFVVTSARFDLFAADGYYPAPPDMAYLKTAVTVSAKGSALEFDSHGTDVTLSYGDNQQVTSLGLVAPSRLVPVPSHKMHVRVEPGQSRKMTFLFLVPAQKLPRGKLLVHGVGTAPTPKVALGKAPEAGALAGRFTEAEPRNLKPLMTDPVIAAVQGARGQELFVHQRRDTLHVYITPGSVRGVAKPVGKGVYETVLKHGKDQRECRLRLAPDGETLIVYFADKPFHQMTYTRVKR